MEEGPRLAQPLEFQRRETDSPITLGSETAAFCIPSFDVELEFRERTLVLGPLWSRIKEKVVTEFLAVHDSHAVGRIVSLGSAQRGPYLFVHSDDYDRWLNHQWPFYRGIESALTKTQVHKRPAILTMVEKELEQFVTRELIATGRLTELVPERCGTSFEDRPIDAESACWFCRG